MKSVVEKVPKSTFEKSPKITQDVLECEEVLIELTTSYKNYNMKYMTSHIFSAHAVFDYD